MSRWKEIPFPVILGLLATVVLDTVIQLTWKRAVSETPEATEPFLILAGALASPYFYLSMAVFVGQMFNWLIVLRHADLSFAQPFTALSYISVLVLSVQFLGETVTATRVLGVGLILVGVLLVSRTPCRTSTAAVESASGEA